MRELFIGYGGHPRAAGFSIEPERVPEFRRRMTEFTEVNPPDPPPRSLDAELAIEDATPELGRELERMQPLGQGNGRALFLARSVTLATVKEAERRGVRFGTPMRAGPSPSDIVFKLRESDGVALVSVFDSFAAGQAAPNGGERRVQQRG